MFPPIYALKGTRNHQICEKSYSMHECEHIFSNIRLIVLLDLIWLAKIPFSASHRNIWKSLEMNRLPRNVSQNSRGNLEKKREYTLFYHGGIIVDALLKSDRRKIVRKIQRFSRKRWVHSLNREEKLRYHSIKTNREIVFWNTSQHLKRTSPSKWVLRFKKTPKFSTSISLFLYFQEMCERYRTSTDRFWASIERNRLMYLTGMI